MTENSIVRVYSAFICYRSILEEENGDLTKKTVMSIVQKKTEWGRVDTRENPAGFLMEK